MIFNVEPVSLHHDAKQFGTFFLAPLIAKVFMQVSALAVSERAGVVLFPSREGWFLQKHWERCRELKLLEADVPGHYLYANRRIVNRSWRVSTKEKRFEICSQSFDGTLGDFLFARLGIDSRDYEAILAKVGIKSDDVVSLPKDTSFVVAVIEALFEDENIKGQLNRARRNFEKYLRKALSKTTSIYCDVGYSGTVSQSISELSGRGVVPVFFQAHYSKNKAPTVALGGYEITSALAAPAIAGTYQDIGRLGQYLEALLRAPENGLIEIDDDLKPVFDDVSELSEYGLEILTEVHSGVTDGLEQILSLPDKSPIINDLCDAILSSYARGTMLTFQGSAELIVENLYSGGNDLSFH